LDENRRENLEEASRKQKPGTVAEFEQVDPLSFLSGRPKGATAEGGL